MADPFVFVPGLNCTGDLFAEQIALVSSNRSVMIANHRRHESVGEIAGAILEEAPPRFVLAGLSLGGYIAFEILRRAPDRVSGLILLNTTARPDTEEGRERRARLIAIAEGGRFSEIPSLQIPMLLAPDRQDDPDLVAIVRRMAEETGPAAFIRQQRAIMSRPDSRPGLSIIGCPTLVIVGDRDAVTPPEVAEEMAEAIPNAELAVMPVCGHLSVLERPRAVNHALTAFLDKAEI